MLQHSASANTIFLLGCQRSGTTLLKMIFGSHPEVRILDHDTPHKAAYRRADLDEFATDVLHLSADSVCCVKGPQLVWYHEWIKDRFPDSRIIWMFRNPVDVVSSMLKLEVFEKPWLWHYNNLEGHHTEIAGTGATKCANIWLKKNQLEANHPNAVLVHYTDLCSNPEPTLSSLCRQIGISFDPIMLRHNEVKTTELPIGGYDHSRPIDPNLKLIDPELVKTVEPITGELYREMLGRCSTTSHTTH